jgi:hypothetical protein
MNLALLLEGVKRFLELLKLLLLPFKFVVESKQVSSQHEALTLNKLSIERDFDIEGSKFRKLEEKNEENRETHLHKDNIIQQSHG